MSVENKKLLTVDDDQYLRTTMIELTSLEQYLQPKYNDLLSYRLKCQTLALDIAQHSIPLMIALREMMEENANSVSTITSVAKQSAFEIDEIQYRSKINNIDVGRQSYDL